MDECREFNSWWWKVWFVVYLIVAVALLVIGCEGPSRPMKYCDCDATYIDWEDTCTCADPPPPPYEEEE